MSRRQRRAQQRLPAADPRTGTAEPLPRAWLAAAVALSVLVYLSALGNPFVYDDFSSVVNNLSIRPPVSWRWLFTYVVFRPLVNLSYALDYSLWGQRPFGYHLTGLLLHAGNVALFFLLCWHAVGDLGRRSPLSVPRRWAAFVPAAIFAVHPMATQAVQYTAARSELLCALFSLAGLLAFRQAALSEQRKTWWVAAYLALLLGLASKEVAGVMPVLALAYDRLVLARDGARRRFWRLYLPPLLVMLVAAGVRLGVYFGKEASGAVAAMAGNFLLQLVVLWHYLALLLLPVGQSLAHEFQEVHSLWNAGALLGLLATTLLLAAAWRVRKRWPLLTMGALWFLLVLVPSSSIVPLAEPMAEHRAYLASAGVFLALLQGASWLAARPLPLRAGIVATVLLALAVATLARNRVWSSPILLWSEATAHAPHTYAPHYALGDAYREKGDCVAAISEYRRASQLVPDEAGAWLNMGICSAQIGDLSQAEQAFARALALEPENASVHYDLGLVARLRGDGEVARRQFEEALRLQPGHQQARQALGLSPP